MAKTAKKRKTDFVFPETATRDNPIIAGVTRSKFKKHGRLGKVCLPEFLVCESGNWNDGEFRLFQPFKTHGSYFVGRKGNPDLSLEVTRHRCGNHNKAGIKCPAIFTCIAENKNWFIPEMKNLMMKINILQQSIGRTNVQDSLIENIPSTVMP